MSHQGSGQCESDDGSQTASSPEEEHLNSATGQVCHHESAVAKTWTEEENLLFCGENLVSGLDHLILAPTPSPSREQLIEAVCTSPNHEHDISLHNTGAQVDPKELWQGIQALATQRQQETEEPDVDKESQVQSERLIGDNTGSRRRDQASHQSPADTNAVHESQEEAREFTGNNEPSGTGNVKGDREDPQEASDHQIKQAIGNVENVINASCGVSEKVAEDTEDKVDLYGNDDTCQLHSEKSFEETYLPVSTDQLQLDTERNVEDSKLHFYTQKSVLEDGFQDTTTNELQRQNDGSLEDSDSEGITEQLQLNTDAHPKLNSPTNQQDSQQIPDDYPSSISTDNEPTQIWGEGNWVNSLGTVDTVECSDKTDLKTKPHIDVKEETHLHTTTNNYEARIQSTGFQFTINQLKTDNAHEDSNVREILDQSKAGTFEKELHDTLYQPQTGTEEENVQNSNVSEILNKQKSTLVESEQLRTDTCEGIIKLSYLKEILEQLKPIEVENEPRVRSDQAETDTDDETLQPDLKEILDQIKSIKVESERQENFHQPQTETSEETVQHSNLDQVQAGTVVNERHESTAQPQTDTAEETVEDILDQFRSLIIDSETLDQSQADTAEQTVKASNIKAILDQLQADTAEKELHASLNEAKADITEETKFQATSHQLSENTVEESVEHNHFEGYSVHPQTDTEELIEGRNFKEEFLEHLQPYIVEDSEVETSFLQQQGNIIKETDREEHLESIHIYTVEETDEKCDVQETLEQTNKETAEDSNITETLDGIKDWNSGETSDQLQTDYEESVEDRILTDTSDESQTGAEQTVADTLDQLQTGAEEPVEDTLDQLQTGAEETVADTLDQLQTGAEETVADTLDQLQTGAEEPVEDTLDQLQTGAEETVADTLDQLQTGAEQTVADTLDQLQTGAEEPVEDTLDQLQTGAEETVADTLDQLQTGAEEPVEDTLDHLQTGAEQTVEDTLDQLQTDAEEPVEDTLDQLQTGAEETVADTLDQLQTGAEEPVEDTLDQLQTGAEETVADTLDQLQTGAEEPVEDTLDQLQTGAEQTVEVTLDQLQKSSEEPVENTLDQLQTGAEENVEDTLDQLQTGAEETVADTLDQLQTGAEEPVEDTLDQLQTGAEETVADTLDQLQTGAEEPVEDTLDQLQTGAEETVADTLDQLQTGAEEPVEDTLDQLQTGAEETVADTLDQLQTGAEETVADTLDQLQTGAEEPVEDTLDQLQTGAEETVADTLDQLQTGAEEPVEDTLDQLQTGGEQTVEDTLDQLQTGGEQTVEDTLDQLQTGAEEPVEDTLHQLQTGAEETVADTLDQLQTGAEEPVEDTLDQLQKRSEEPVADTLDQLQTGAEEPVEDTLDQLQTGAEQTVEVTLDQLQKSSEEPVENTLDQLQTGAEENVEDTLDQLQTSAEETVADTLDQLQTGAEEPVEDTLDQLQTGAEETIEDTLDQLQTGAEETVADTLDQLQTGAEEPVEDTLDQSLPGAERTVEDTLDQLQTGAEETVADTLDQSLPGAERTVEDTLDQLQTGDEQTVEDTSDQLQKSAEESAEDTLDQLRIGAEKSTEDSCLVGVSDQVCTVEEENIDGSSLSKTSDHLQAENVEDRNIKEYIDKLQTGDEEASDQESIKELLEQLQTHVKKATKESILNIRDDESDIQQFTVFRLVEGRVGSVETNGFEGRRDQLQPDIEAVVGDSDAHGSYSNPDVENLQYGTSHLEHEETVEDTTASEAEEQSRVQEFWEKVVQHTIQLDAATSVGSQIRPTKDGFVAGKERDQPQITVDSNETEQKSSQKSIDRPSIGEKEADLATESFQETENKPVEDSEQILRDEFKLNARSSHFQDAKSYPLLGFRDIGGNEDQFRPDNNIESSSSVYHQSKSEFLLDSKEIEHFVKSSQKLETGTKAPDIYLETDATVDYEIERQSIELCGPISQSELNGAGISASTVLQETANKYKLDLSETELDDDTVVVIKLSESREVRCYTKPEENDAIEDTHQQQSTQEGLNVLTTDFPRDTEDNAVNIDRQRIAAQTLSEERTLHPGTEIYSISDKLELDKRSLSQTEFTGTANLVCQETDSCTELRTATDRDLKAGVEDTVDRTEFPEPTQQYQSNEGQASHVSQLHGESNDLELNIQDISSYPRGDIEETVHDTESQELVHKSLLDDEKRAEDTKPGEIEHIQRGSVESVQETTFPQVQHQIKALTGQVVEDAKPQNIEDLNSETEEDTQDTRSQETEHLQLGLEKLEGSKLPETKLHAPLEPEEVVEGKKTDDLQQESTETVQEGKSDQEPNQTLKLESKEAIEENKSQESELQFDVEEPDEDFGDSDHYLRFESETTEKDKISQESEAQFDVEEISEGTKFHETKYNLQLDSEEVAEVTKSHGSQHKLQLELEKAEKGNKSEGSEHELELDAQKGEVDTKESEETLENTETNIQLDSKEHTEDVDSQGTKNKLNLESQKSEEDTISQESGLQFDVEEVSEDNKSQTSEDIQVVSEEITDKFFEGTVQEAVDNLLASARKTIDNISLPLHDTVLTEQNDTLSRKEPYFWLKTTDSTLDSNEREGALDRIPPVSARDDEFLSLNQSVQQDTEKKSEPIQSGLDTGRQQHQLDTDNLVQEARPPQIEWEDYDEDAELQEAIRLSQIDNGTIADNSQFQGIVGHIRASESTSNTYLQGYVNHSAQTAEYILESTKQRITADPSQQSTSPIYNKDVIEKAIGKVDTEAGGSKLLGITRTTSENSFVKSPLEVDIPCVRPKSNSELQNSTGPHSVVFDSKSKQEVSDVSEDNLEEQSELRVCIQSLTVEASISEIPKDPRKPGKTIQFNDEATFSIYGSPDSEVIREDDEYVDSETVELRFNAVPSTDTCEAAAGGWSGQVSSYNSVENLQQSGTCDENSYPVNLILNSEDSSEYVTNIDTNSPAISPLEKKIIASDIVELVKLVQENLTNILTRSRQSASRVSSPQRSRNPSRERISSESIHNQSPKKRISSESIRDQWPSKAFQHDDLTGSLFRFHQDSVEELRKSRRLQKNSRDTLKQTTDDSAYSKQTESPNEQDLADIFSSVKEPCPTNEDVDDNAFLVISKKSYIRDDSINHTDIRIVGEELDEDPENLRAEEDQSQGKSSTVKELDDETIIGSSELSCTRDDSGHRSRIRITGEEVERVSSLQTSDGACVSEDSIQSVVEDVTGISYVRADSVCPTVVNVVGEEEDKNIPLDDSDATDDVDGLTITEIRDVTDDSVYHTGIRIVDKEANAFQQESENPRIAQDLEQLEVRNILEHSSEFARGREDTVINKNISPSSSDNSSHRGLVGSVKEGISNEVLEDPTTVFLLGVRTTNAEKDDCAPLKISHTSCSVEDSDRLSGISLNRHRQSSTTDFSNLAYAQGVLAYSGAEAGGTTPVSCENLSLKKSSGHYFGINDQRSDDVTVIHDTELPFIRDHYNGNRTLSDDTGIPVDLSSATNLIGVVNQELTGDKTRSKSKTIITTTTPYVTEECAGISEFSAEGVNETDSTVRESEGRAESEAISQASYGEISGRTIRADCKLEEDFDLTTYEVSYVRVGSGYPADSTIPCEDVDDSLNSSDNLSSTEDSLHPSDLSNIDTELDDLSGLNPSDISYVREDSIYPTGIKTVGDDVDKSVKGVDNFQPREISSTDTDLGDKYILSGSKISISRQDSAYCSDVKISCEGIDDTVGSSISESSSLREFSTYSSGVSITDDKSENEIFSGNAGISYVRDDSKYPTGVRIVGEDIDSGNTLQEKDNLNVEGSIHSTKYKALKDETVVNNFKTFFASDGSVSPKGDRIARENIDSETALYVSSILKIGDSTHSTKCEGLEDRAHVNNFKLSHASDESVSPTGVGGENDSGTGLYGTGNLNSSESAPSTGKEFDTGALADDSEISHESDDTVYPTGIEIAVEDIAIVKKPNDLSVGKDVELSSKDLNERGAATGFWVSFKSDHFVPSSGSRSVGENTDISISPLKHFTGGESAHLNQIGSSDQEIDEEAAETVVDSSPVNYIKDDSVYPTGEDTDSNRCADYYTEIYSTDNSSLSSNKGEVLEEVAALGNSFIGKTSVHPAGVVDESSDQDNSERSGDFPNCLTPSEVRVAATEVIKKLVKPAEDSGTDSIEYIGIINGKMEHAKDSTSSGRKSSDALNYSDDERNKKAELNNLSDNNTGGSDNLGVDHDSDYHGAERLDLYENNPKEENDAESRDAKWTSPETFSGGQEESETMSQLDVTRLVLNGQYHVNGEFYLEVKPSKSVHEATPAVEDNQSPCERFEAIKEPQGLALLCQPEELPDPNILQKGSFSFSEKSKMNSNSAASSTGSSAVDGEIPFKLKKGASDEQKKPADVDTTDTGREEEEEDNDLSQFSQYRMEAAQLTNCVAEDIYVRDDNVYPLGIRICSDNYEESVVLSAVVNDKSKPPAENDTNTPQVKPPEDGKKVARNLSSPWSTSLNLKGFVSSFLPSGFKRQSKDQFATDQSAQDESAAPVREEPSKALVLEVTLPYQVKENTISVDKDSIVADIKEKQYRPSRNVDEENNLLSNVVQNKPCWNYSAGVSKALLAISLEALSKTTTKTGSSGNQEQGEGAGALGVTPTEIKRPKEQVDEADFLNDSSLRAFSSVLVRPAPSPSPSNISLFNFSLKSMDVDSAQASTSSTARSWPEEQAASDKKPEQEPPPRVPTFISHQEPMKTSTSDSWPLKPQDQSTDGAKSKHPVPDTLSLNAFTGLAGRDMCRICHCGSRSVPGLGPLVSPCYCRGTVALVHISCLERWLTESGAETCELCGYRFHTERIPRHSGFTSLMLWLSTTGDVKQLVIDVVWFTLMTPLAVMAGYLIVLAIRVLIQAQDTPWSMVALLMSCTITLAAYYGWVSGAVRYHARNWFRWCRTNYNVHLLSETPSGTYTTNTASCPPPAAIATINTPIPTTPSAAPAHAEPEENPP